MGKKKSNYPQSTSLYCHQHAVNETRNINIKRSKSWLHKCKAVGFSSFSSTFAESGAVSRNYDDACHTLVVALAGITSAIMGADASVPMMPLAPF